MSQLLQEMRTRLVVDPTVMMKSDSEISSIHSNESDSQLETAILVRQNMSIEIARGKKETSIFSTQTESKIKSSPSARSPYLFILHLVESLGKVQFIL